ncbi:hypothetical protein EVAR_83067_1 [Eumeta japonica]|uniref:Uncharacterized protein n=1 Tax=Eumeta variegata TaxID=151549 RepID=A0A4C1VN29_EUMVA|nr:hypothetical protein EVAR_83067_1 [Eumeta japonica]
MWKLRSGLWVCAHPPAGWVKKQINAFNPCRWLHARKWFVSVCTSKVGGTTVSSFIFKQDILTPRSPCPCALFVTKDGPRFGFVYKLCIGMELIRDDQRRPVKIRHTDAFPVRGGRAGADAGPVH